MSLLKFIAVIISGLAVIYFGLVLLALIYGGIKRSRNKEAFRPLTHFYCKVCQYEKDYETNELVKLYLNMHKLQCERCGSIYEIVYDSYLDALAGAVPKEFRLLISRRKEYEQQLKLPFDNPFSKRVK